MPSNALKSFIISAASSFITSFCIDHVCAQDIVTSHAFSAEELTAQPQENWNTNGVNTTVTTFEHDDEQRVVVHAGGTAFATSDRGGTKWLFSLDGTIDQQLSEQPSAPGPGSSPPVSPENVLQADFDNGSTIYDNACAACHGEIGQGGQDGQGGGPALSGNLSLSETMLVINDGRNTMPAFDVLTEQELVDISTFVVERMSQ